ncbi:cysteine proteinase [Leucogyrophana mollusca]|uniref:Cysteine proteinase n=1 Tax=Leucogyrophana mollusca TaxID=85980 RepID=A0ACB8BQD2_9AGAM|nr:cysteine proteinase [Leucogyrophana mollusca]
MSASPSPESAHQTLSEASMSDIGRCSHFASALIDGAAKASILDKYKTVVAWQARRSQEASSPAKRRKISAPTCGTCEVSLSRPFACLRCSYAGCWSEGHISDHLKGAGHAFCVDTRSGSVFCAECNDFIYDTSMDNIYLSTVVAVEERQTNFQVAKRGREPYQIWTPSDEESAALNDATVLPCQGRRGLLNLGQTCFLNVILQSFIHNPLLRNYFLGDRHNNKLCKHTDCTCCEMDNLFQEIYSANTTPFGPTSFLATTWKVSAEVSGYSQQDAHEFFITALNQIHGTCRGSTNISCNCIIHSTFAGQLQSDVTCERCGNVTSTVDPMLDISLELKGKTGEAVSGDNTLAGCLRRFTKPEKLGAKEYSCSKCTKVSPEAVKRLSIRKLPPVLSFQFKRFEHKTAGKSSPQKIDAAVRFPVTLNMAPYTTLVMNSKAKDGEKGYPGPDAMYEYDLFAVINHEGQMDNGHYTNFARFQDEWYRFDDDKVTPSTLGACLDSHAYMCFYVKRHLDYKPYMKPSYRLTRESDIVKEQALEKEKEAARMKEVDDALMAMVGAD